MSTSFRKHCVIVLVCIVLISSIGACAESINTSKIRANAEFDAFLQAFLCASQIKYDSKPEECIDFLRSLGYEFECEERLTFPEDSSPFDIVYNEEGIPQLYFMLEYELIFSESVSLCMRTEAELVALKSMEEESLTHGLSLFQPVEIPADGKIVNAQLEFYDNSSQQWYTWTFSSNSEYAKVN